jgi:hypothetical protein
MVLETQAKCDKPDEAQEQNWSGSSTGRPWP